MTIKSIVLRPGVVLLLSITLLAGCSRSSNTPIPTLTPALTLTSIPTPAPEATISPRPPATSTPDPGTLAVPLSREEMLEIVPGLAEREASFAAALTSDQPILLLSDGLNAKQQAAQRVAVASPELQSLVRNATNQQSFRSEIMGVRPALPSDLTTATEACTSGDCYRVELFNYVSNTTIIAVVDLDSARVIDVTYHPDVQPEIPPHLAALAAQIAIHSPEVIAALGFKPGAGQATMPNVKTALNGSQCERSRHLCVAPTFLLIDQGRALWAIVDLTASQLVGVRWTDLGNGGTQPVTEQNLQDAVIMTEYCEQSRPLQQGDWEMAYTLTSSDGLEITDVLFQGQPVVRSAKLVDWHVSYSGTEGFGYSDATGCPMFSTASVVAFNPPVIEEIRDGDEIVGFALTQDFRSELWPLPCNYRYMQRFEFYQDGRFRIGGANLGRGCGNNGTYRPVLRVDLPIFAADGETSVAEWDGLDWKPWTVEGWTLQTVDTPYTPEGYQFRFLGDDGRGYYLEPNNGQFGDQSRGDNAYVYVTSRKSDEGDADMITIGSCCNEDYQQGPEKFMNPPESILAADVVLWYVPQLKNSDIPGAEYCWTESGIVEGMIQTKTYPCAFGPMFTPINEIRDE